MWLLGLIGLICAMGFYAPGIMLLSSFLLRPILIGLVGAVILSFITSIFENHKKIIFLKQEEYIKKWNLRKELNGLLLKNKRKQNVSLQKNSVYLQRKNPGFIKRMRQINVTGGKTIK